MTRAAFAFACAFASACAPASSSAPTPAAPFAPAQSLSASHKQAYASATTHASAGDLPAAIRDLAPISARALSATDDALAYWIHNELTWLHWGSGDLPSALAETSLGAQAIDRSTLATDEKASMRLHALWDRAYLLLELKDAGADAAFADYETLAKARDDHDGLAVLTAFFAARRHRGADAMIAAKRVDVEKDTDLQDLYVIALALDEGGDHTSAAAVRQRICRGHEYLMKPLIVAQMAREGVRCPRAPLRIDER